MFDDDDDANKPRRNGFLLSWVKPSNEAWSASLFFSINSS